MQTSIITERLLINPLTIDDSSFIFELVNTDGWLEFIGNRNVNSEAEAVPYVQNIIDNPNISYWIVRIKDDDLPIGAITFIKREYLAHYDIGFAFLPAFTKKGYAYEAAKAVMYNEHHSDQHSHIFGITNANNFYAIKLLKKLGLQFEKEIEVEDEKLQLYGISTDKLQ